MPMTHDAIGASGRLSLNPRGPDDAELARIRELRAAMALSPKELIAKLKGGWTETGNAEPNAHDGPGGIAGIPALAEFAALATTLERNPLPPFRAGPTAVPPPLPPAPIAGNGSKDAGADAPSLSAWAPDDRQAGQQLYAAGLGLLAGLVLVVATLLWLGGWLDAQRRSKVRAPALATERSAQRGDGATRQSAARPDLARRDDRISPGDARGVFERPAATVTPPPSPELLVQQALRRIERGDVSGARELLASAGNDPRGLVSFTLAETYDPNMLAAWGLRGIAADIEKAKGSYGEALARGHAAARRRLDSLK